MKAKKDCSYMVKVGKQYQVFTWDDLMGMYCQSMASYTFNNARHIVSVTKKSWDVKSQGIDLDKYQSLI
jgi:hypothetical protein